MWAQSQDSGGLEFLGSGDVEVDLTGSPGLILLFFFFSVEALIPGVTHSLDATAVREASLAASCSFH